MPTKLPDHIRSEDEPQIISPIDRNRKRQYGTYSYKPEYCDIVFKLLSSGSQCKTKSHCCHALHCTKNTLIQWINKFPDFRQAIESGLEIGAVKWRNKIRKHAFEPTGNVNNGLIKLLSSNVYGIKEDAEPTVVINNTQNNFDPEIEMKKRGIPVPSINALDIEGGDCDDCG